MVLDPMDRYASGEEGKCHETTSTKGPEFRQADMWIYKFQIISRFFPPPSPPSVSPSSSLPLRQNG